MAGMKSISNDNFLKKPKCKYKVADWDRILFILLLLLSMIFLGCMGVFQNSDTYKIRDEVAHTKIDNVEKKDIYDENTPEGVKKIYTWKLDNSEGENYIGFYTVHQNTYVYFDGNLVYSSNSQNNKTVGKTLGQIYVMIPICPEDNGTEVSVEIIPVYKQVLNIQTEFFKGSKFLMYYNQFKKDFSQIVLSFISVGIGIVLFVTSIIKRYKEKQKNNLLYLGIFAFSIGIWRLTDIRFASMIFLNNSKLVYCISIVMMYLSAGALELSIKNQFIKEYGNYMKCIIVTYCIVCLSLIFLQIVNILDLREGLLIWHIIIAIHAIMTSALIAYEIKKNENDIKIRVLNVCMILCIIGVLADLISYYIKGNSDNLLVTVVALITYFTILGYIAMNRIKEKADLDIQTGVYNKRRCEEIFNNNKVITESLGVIMFDLNGLKHTNDTLGHNYGDILICEFANIIKTCINNKDFVGRYGGDEFIAVIKEADKDVMDSIESHINMEIIKYNKKSKDIVISYSMGYSLSKEYPELSLHELLVKADEYMYEHKREYYRSKKIMKRYV
ncbi:MAG TPA: hypothetical protein DG753_05890 [Clostridium sp.]|nr:hypothetical protein [Clostridium sp.]